jgi:hypothetical protein
VIPKSSKYARIEPCRSWNHTDTHIQTPNTTHTSTHTHACTSRAQHTAAAFERHLPGPGCGRRGRCMSTGAALLPLQDYAQVLNPGGQCACRKYYITCAANSSNMHQKDQGWMQGTRGRQKAWQDRPWVIGVDVQPQA